MSSMPGEFHESIIIFFCLQVWFLFALWVGIPSSLLLSLLLVAAIMNIVLSQPCGKIFVGDPHQQIYTFRGAVNALFTVPHTHVFYLTQVSALCAPKFPEVCKPTLFPVMAVGLVEAHSMLQILTSTIFHDSQESQNCFHLIVLLLFTVVTFVMITQSSGG